MWGLVSAGLLAAAFFIPFWPTWLVLAALFFGIPEAIGVARKDDAYPPLTHVIRHFLPNYLAFPLIYFFFGSIAAQWLEFPRPFRVGGLFGLLGWLTDHFDDTYAGDDPFPGSDSERVSRQQEAL
jgi:hypothetical protein